MKLLPRFRSRLVPILLFGVVAAGSLPTAAGRIFPVARGGDDPLRRRRWPFRLAFVGRNAEATTKNAVGRARRTPPSDVPAALPRRSFLQNHPFLSAVLITTCNAVAADLLAQRLSADTAKNWWDPQRSLLFAVFGFLFQGCIQYVVVNLVWERLFPGSAVEAVVKKIAAMNFISDPLLFFPCFYTFRQFLAQLQSADTVDWSSTVPRALAEYRNQCWSDWRNSWTVWFPGHVVTYGVLPPHQRLPWIASLSFVYICILSSTRG